MGGIGSGRWEGHEPKRLIEHQTKINVHAWQRRRLLIKGNFFSWNMWEEYGADWPATIKVTGGSLQVNYQVQNELGYQELITNQIDLGWTENQLGSRVWFMCPDCGRRVANLYLVGKFLQCRHCCQLGYQSQRI